MIVNTPHAIIDIKERQLPSVITATLEQVGPDAWVCHYHFAGESCKARGRSMEEAAKHAAEHVRVYGTEIVFEGEQS